MSIAENLKKLIASVEGMNPTRLARETGVPQPTIWRILKGESEDPDTSTLQPLAKRFGKAVAQLRGEIPLTLEGVIDPEAPSYRLPLISWVAAGMAEANDPYAKGAAESWEPFEQKYSAQAYCLRVRGDSMLAPDGSGFPEGSIIAVDPALAAKSGDYVVVRFNTTDEATFKQYVVDGPYQFLKPLNPRYNVMPIPEDAQLCGVVVEVNLKRRFR